MGQIQQPTAPYVAMPRDRAALVAYLAALLGVLSAVWGFLDWWGTGSAAANGYRLGEGYAVAGFPLAAGLVALRDVRLPRSAGTRLLAVGLSMIGSFFAIVALVVKPTVVELIQGLYAFEQGRGAPHLSAKIGLILALVTVLVQFVVLTIAWLTEIARLRVRAGGPRPSGVPQYGPAEQPGYEPQPPAQQGYQPPQS